MDITELRRIVSKALARLLEETGHKALHHTVLLPSGHASIRLTADPPFHEKTLATVREELIKHGVPVP